MLRVLVTEPTAADQVAQLERERRSIIDRDNVMNFRGSFCTARARFQLAEVAVPLQRELPNLPPCACVIEALFF